jgi:hypothetical protein
MGVRFLFQACAKNCHQLFGDGAIESPTPDHPLAIRTSDVPVASDEPILGPFPHIPAHVVQRMTALPLREGAHRSGSRKAIVFGVQDRIVCL